VTVSYQRARLMLEAGDRAGARKLTTSVLARLSDEGMAAARNALLRLRIETAGSYAEFLADAPRTMIVVPDGVKSVAAFEALCGPSDKSPGCLEKLPPLQFDWDVPTTFNRQLALSRWVEAANGADGKTLPGYLREAIGMAGWLRAQGLGDEKTVKALVPMLPQAMRAGEGMGFPVTLALLRNPGIRPFLEQGVQRSVSYRRLEEFRDNWWCTKWGDGPSPSDPQIGERVKDTDVPMAFLSKEERVSAAEERRRLNELPFGVVWVGRRTIEYVKAHPEDKDGAEALALTVRATRYGCFVGGDTDKSAVEQKTVSKEAFTMLHKQYPKSQWAAKTPYYY
jgi:hypothetical protein